MQRQSNTSLPAIQFTEQTQAAGIHFTHYNSARGDYHYVETFGAGAAFFDYDNDGWQDLYLVNGANLYDSLTISPPQNQLYHNLGNGQFHLNPPSAAADPGYGMGVSAADYDNDGDQDLYISNFGPNQLLQNNAGKFTNTTQQMGVGDNSWGTGTGFLDYDLDGDLDLFVVNYVLFNQQESIICRQGSIRSYCEPSVYPPSKDLLYRNDGHTFIDISQEVGIILEGRGLGLAFADYDLDGDTDIYVANDGTMNFLYQNQNGYFFEKGIQVGVAFNEAGSAEAGMGVDFGDYDNDGDQDLFVTNFAFESNTLYRNEGKGQYLDITNQIGLDQLSYLALGFGTGFIDVDNNRFLDLFITNGHVMDVVTDYDSTQTYAQRNQLLYNVANQKFIDISNQVGPSLKIPNIGRGTAFADYDNDGDQDCLITTIAGSPRLLRNDGGNRNNWLQIQLIGYPQRTALGSRVQVITGPLTQTQEHQSGQSYLSNHASPLHFGLDSAIYADIIVHWPDGKVQALKKIESNQLIVLDQRQRLNKKD